MFLLLLINSYFQQSLSSSTWSPNKNVIIAVDSYLLSHYLPLSLSLFCFTVKICEISDLLFLPYGVMRNKLSIGFSPNTFIIYQRWEAPGNFYEAIISKYLPKIWHCYDLTFNCLSPYSSVWRRFLFYVRG